MGAATILGRFSYPKVPGDQPWSIIDLQGPASYPNGGQLIYPADFGLQSFDFVAAMQSVFGYTVEIVPTTATIGGAYSVLSVQWYLAGDPVAFDTDLSAASVRLLAIGRY